MTAAKKFLGIFQENSEGSKAIRDVGFVAFNTNAQVIFGLQACKTEQQKKDMASTMETETHSIIKASTYDGGWTKFTNIEAGLKLANNMLNESEAKNKYIIFLSDGFPTTYLKDHETGATSGIIYGYEPWSSQYYSSEYAIENPARTNDTDGIFYNAPLNQFVWGCDYSDRGAMYAEQAAAAAKNDKIEIFSVGVGIGDQKVSDYEIASHCTVDRPSGTPRIGTDKSGFETWLGTMIGSNHYVSCTDTSGLESAFSGIFDGIKEQIGSSITDTWVTEDAMGRFDAVAEGIEFLGFYDKDGKIQNTLNGVKGENLVDNTATFNTSTRAIRWDLLNSKPAGTSTAGNTTTYTYKLKYHVRLENELSSFIPYDEKSVDTNGTTTLKYKISENGKLSDEKTVNFPSPAVKGYLGDLVIHKEGEDGKPLEGATFTLVHNSNCSGCSGKVNVPTQTKTSGEDGAISFTNIPSGHKYTLTETKPAEGYKDFQPKWVVTVSYGEVTVRADSNIAAGTDGRRYSFKITEGADERTGFVTPDADGSITVVNEPIPRSEKDVFNGNLGLTGSINGRQVVPGSELDYVITYANQTNLPGEATVTDKIPDNTELVRVDQGGSYDASTRTITWTIPDVPAYGTGTVTFTVRLLDTAWQKSMDNQAHVEVNNVPSDTNWTHNTTPHKDVFFHDEEDTNAKKDAANGGDTGLSIDTYEVKPGDILTYRIDWMVPVQEGDEPGTKYTVRILDEAPVGTNFHGADNNIYDRAGNVIAHNENTNGKAQWRFEVPAGSSGYVLFHVIVTNSALSLPDHTIPNTADVQVKIHENDPEITTNRVYNTVDDKDVLNPDTGESIDTNTVKAGDVLQYEVKWHNGEGVNNVTITDMIPDGTRYVEGSADWRVYDENGKLIGAKNMFANPLPELPDFDANEDKTTPDEGETAPDEGETTPENPGPGFVIPVPEPEEPGETAPEGGDNGDIDPNPNPVEPGEGGDEGGENQPDPDEPQTPPVPQIPERDEGGSPKLPGGSLPIIPVPTISASETKPDPEPTSVPTISAPESESVTSGTEKNENEVVAMSVAPKVLTFAAPLDEVSDEGSGSDDNEPEAKVPEDFGPKFEPNEQQHPLVQVDPEQSPKTEIVRPNPSDDNDPDPTPDPEPIEPPTTEIKPAAPADDNTVDTGDSEDTSLTGSVTFDEIKTLEWVLKNVPEGALVVVDFKVIVNSDNDIEGSETRDTIYNTAHIEPDHGPKIKTNTTVNPTRVGSLTISKAIDPNGAKDFMEGREFTFTLKLTAPTGALLRGTYTGTYSVDNGHVANVDIVKGTATFTLKAGESITFADIPVNTSYEVVEANDHGYVANDGDNTVTGTITEADQTYEVEFTNRLPNPGSLTIHKTVVGVPTNQSFDFKVTLTLANNDLVNVQRTFTATLGGETVDSGYYFTLSGVNFYWKSGNTFEGIVSLKNGEDKTISGIPARTAYSVTEVQGDNLLYKGEVTDAQNKDLHYSDSVNDNNWNGTIGEDDKFSTSYTNALYIPAKITLSGTKYLNGSPTGEAFEFTVTNVATGEDLGTFKNGSDGKIDFTLDLPVDSSHPSGQGASMDKFGFNTTFPFWTYTLKISEKTQSAGRLTCDTRSYLVKITINGNPDGSTVANIDSITHIDAEGNTVAEAVQSDMLDFYNRRTTPDPDPDPDPANTSLTVTKVWADAGHEEERPSSVTVQLKRDGDFYGETVTLSETNNWKHTWTGLDDDYAWSVDEVSVPDGYTKSISGSGTSYTITNTFDNPPPPPPPEETEIPDGDIPLTDLPDDDVPTSDIPWQEELEELPEPDVPLANVPTTGDSSMMWLLASAASAAGLVWLAITGRKKEDDAE